ncbi:patatin [Nitritalea halalkaliphila LW7]|uniref:Patatin n=1 Tax=Nitritalea halalkaliphila LW7 TaxID=1189621 RepID=I5BWC5_9BACT|nr:patatin-like phospholipase family protein [Nitritalea halalkaliphila]EIM73877.1 patatin [Nitritalea halalkaliphila LW7]
MAEKRVSLVLASGGARGMAHIGAIEALEEKGYTIVSVSGCSAGALVGGIYCAGKLPAFKEWICNLDKIDVFSLMDFTLSSKGFIKGEKVFKEIREMVGQVSIETLNIPFNCTAVDVYAGTEKVFDSGDLLTAIRASVSIPTIFTPAEIAGRSYIDGGILNPLPLNLVPEQVQADLLLAVDLNADAHTFQEPELLLSTEKLADGADKSSSKLTKITDRFKIPGWVNDYREKFRARFGEEEALPLNEKEKEEVKTLSSLELLNHSFDLLQDRLSELYIEKHPVDILVEIARNQAGTLEFHRAPELIAIGKDKTLKALQKYENGN